MSEPEMVPSAEERFNSVVGHPNAVLHATDGARVRAEFERCYSDGYRAALSALLSSPITEEEVEAVAMALWEAWCVADSGYETTWDELPDKSKTRDMARAAIIAYRTVIGGEG